MAGELIWSRTAVDDLAAIAAFIARDSPIHARRLLERAFEQCALLLTQPALGHPLPEANQDSLHELDLHGFRILFERQGEDVHLLGIVHGHRLMDAMPGRFPR